MYEPLPDWSHLSFHPVVLLPPHTPVLDLRRPPTAAPPTWSIGRYAEDRAIYTTPLFGGTRSVHMGIDLGGPAGVAVHAFWPGKVVYAGFNPAEGDYGHVLVTRHDIDGVELFALFGHLSADSLARSPAQRDFAAGEVLGWLGAPDENGGWPPHLHLQLARSDPGTHDMPGAVAPADLAEARKRYPDPRLVLGPLY